MLLLSLIGCSLYSMRCSEVQIGNTLVLKLLGMSGCNQMGSLENIMVSMRSTVEEFHKIVLSLERIHRDGRQLVKGGSSCPTMKQLQQRLGIKPSLTDCLDGLLFLHDIHDSDRYQLKTSIILAVSAGALKLSGNDLSELLQLLIDQPNIPSEEVQFVFDVICAEEC
ncbi:uncharacterized protein At5g43822 isoform X4 [Prosopis cineraria]|uniref:uncharacterized protein At5g43822 isoform X4 n=1 Tax=Prosopis cineraria TaxID=364024 RepID=UPI0024105302|nr:uncharacterized protein At5g43822 isoform X4 [Prosopis cineraria]